MRANPRICATLLAIVLSLRVSVSQAVAPALAPFVVTASNGPAAGSQVVANVTRTMSKTVETLPAALVPASARCRLYGSDLAAIDAVEGSAGSFVAPGLDCPPTDKGVACVIVPRAAHYTVRLIDGGTLETLPDAAIAAAPP